MPLVLDVGLTPVPGYPLVRRLGRGGFGEVWEALAPGGVRVALKFIRLDTGQAVPEKRALEVIRDIRHPHLLDVQFAVQVEDCLIIAMPLCDESLMDRLNACQTLGQPGIPCAELLGYMDELARAVDYLNEPRHPSGDGRLVGVQHRDIKPHNIFLVGGSARLADFGLAKILDATGGSHTGAMTPNYVAPEVLDGKVTRWTDQYALAVTYVHLRTGHLPFSGSMSEVMSGHLHRPPELSGLPEGERAAVARALAKRPEERWPTCRDFVRALGPEAVRTEAPTVVDPFPKATVPQHFAPIAVPTTEIDRPQRAQPIPATAGPEKADEAGATNPRRLPWIIAASLGVLIMALTVLIVLGFVTFPSPTAPGRDLPASTSTSVAELDRKAEAPVVPSKTTATATVTEPAQAEEKPSAIPVVELAAAPKPGEPTAEPGAADPALARQAHALLKKYCYGCHGSRFEVPGYNVLDRDNLVALPTAGKKRKAAYVVPGKPEASLFWKRAGIDEDMPPEDPFPTDSEKATLKRWIEAGAPFPVLDRPRPFVAEKDVLTAIRDDLQATEDSDRKFRRYFTLAHLHNNRKVLDDDMRLYRAALSKLANSLSWKPRIVVPRALDQTGQTVFAIDLRDFGWDRSDLWQSLIRREEPPKGQKYLGARDEFRKGYPYGLGHQQLPKDEATNRLAREVSRLSGCELPYVRADWFIATAARPPLYEVVLDLPQHASELEKKLDVDVRFNFLRDRLARAGFASSGVSSHNRMVERHDGAFGAYWKSYDFKSDEGTGELARFPLGPAFEGNPFERQAFEHAGGEIIFNLPNKLQGYLLTNNQDQRIEVGPIEIVGDSLQTSGTATIVNGLSCMSCHKNGMIAGIEDAIRAGNALSGEPRDKVLRLYPTKTAMDRLLADDEETFVGALDKATGAFLKIGADADKPIRDFPEPIGASARLYNKDLGLDEVAAELGLAGPDELKVTIENNPALRKLGLGPLVQPGGKIKRAAWESLRFFNSPFQDASLQLELGTPHHEL